MAESTQNSSGSNGKNGGKSTDKDEATEKEEPRYSIEEILARPYDLTGHGAVAVAGALAGETRQTLTEAQAKEAVKKFMRSEV